jgi:uncharacterized protein
MPEGATLDEQMEALDHFLMSDDSPEECMMLCDLDGFLTGIAIGPELIPPSEWWPAIWGSKGPAFKTAAQAQSVLRAIMNRYNHILMEVAAREINPIFTEAYTGEVIASDWAEGFMQAVYLRPGSWDKLLDDDDGFQLLVPIMALCCDRDGGSLLGLDEETEARYFEKGGDLVPAAAQAIADYWKLHLPEPAPPAHQTKAGRNEACPCGSGKKYKRCCGAN